VKINIRSVILSGKHGIFEHWTADVNKKCQLVQIVKKM